VGKSTVWVHSLNQPKRVHNRIVDLTLGGADMTGIVRQRENRGHQFHPHLFRSIIVDGALPYWHFTGH